MAQTTLSEQILRDLAARLKAQHDAFARQYPGESGTRQPVHTVYGGSHLFKSDTTRKLGDLALKALNQYAPNASTFAEAIGIDPGVADTVYARVQEKLKREAVEDFRIDLLSGELAGRALRTLDLFLSSLGGKLPPNFVVTLPKITAPEQVSALVGAFEALE